MCHYHHLTLVEREKIMFFHAQDNSVSAIAKKLGRNKVLWSSVFVTRVSNKLMLNTSLRMAYDIRYKNAVVHGCMWYKQNVPQRGRETPHLDTCEDKFPNVVAATEH